MGFEVRENRPSPPSHGCDLRKITTPYLLELSFLVSKGGIKIVPTYKIKKRVIQNVLWAAFPPGPVANVGLNGQCTSGAHISLSPVSLKETGCRESEGSRQD